MKKIKYIIRSLIGLLLLSFIFMFFSFAYSSIESISIKNLDKKMNDFRETEKNTSDLEKLSKEWKNIEKSYLKFKNEFLIRLEDLSEFRNELQSLARRNSLRILNIRFQYIPVIRNEVEKAVINLDLEGFYGNMKKFIFEIEEKDKIVFFNSIKMGKTKTNIIGKFVLEVYFVR